MKAIKYYLSFPGLLIHELSHIIVLYLSFGKLKSIDFNRFEKYNYIFILNIKKSPFRIGRILTSISPALALMFLFVLFYQISFTLFYIFTLYFVLEFKILMPSYKDMKVLKYNLLSKDKQFEKDILTILKNNNENYS